jgi:predicted enzyme related to lactoylglutathione lyase
MATRTNYAPGTFSWAELATSDAAAAKDFYAALFGWAFEDNPIPDGSVYSMAQLDGAYVAAVFAAEQRPPHWSCYVTVDSVDEVTSRAGGHGGSVVSEPFDVMDAGRMSVIADPTGAVLCLWEPRQHIGAQMVNAPGAMTWNDLVTSDPEAAASFYGELLGWTTIEIPDAGGYRVIRNGERSNGGIMPLDPARMGAGVPSAWLPYFGHPDVERLAGELPGLGGRVLSGPMQVPAGLAAVVADPQGAAFAVWTGTYED